MYSEKYERNKDEYHNIQEKTNKKEMIERQTNIIKTIIGISISVMFIIVVIIGSLYSYTQYFVYRKSTQIIELKEYLEQNREESITEQNKKFENLTVDKSKLNAIVQLRMPELSGLVEDEYQINSIITGKESDSICISISRNSLKIPVVAKVKLIQNYSNLAIRLSDFEIESKYLMLPNLLTKIFKGKTNVDIQLPSDVEVSELWY